MSPTVAILLCCCRYRAARRVCRPAPALKALCRWPLPLLQGPCVLEYSLPDLVLRRCMSGRQLTGGGGAEEPEGLVCAEGSLYVAWLDSMAVSSTPLEALPPAGQGAAGALAGGRQRMQRRPPGRALWVMWGMRRGPDGALYVSCNPPYFVEGQRYSDVPAAAGRGFVACLALGEGGELVPAPDV